ncbi:hypothetical protein HMPREF9714_03156 [Myroides odoratimimus CCUG 12901]|uniref:Uncharacterized protein n=3 Tax=Myroides odoratimimus TaxID=76832 RepID=A0A0U3F441_9FLAO|nr:MULTISPECIES: hypothetical protein [Myroides]ALU25115.1 hypothetical protein AS202_02600 [Myroides odoratimimus]APA91155.1 hypothetical protein BK054_02720 [Myroides sp. ZB35]EHO04963.1 hypothetical protein HMPREF9715_03560 [Myroides odoratimimus CIP 101113]EHO05749.1 hypothetical protein HMPREF9714_03156 [Myroides odoratimimus CCUG 12901]EHO07302.1 hypothetical protein HMPREF9712_02701 [Myroides odoratimimus CCUG 10230]
MNKILMSMIIMMLLLVSCSSDDNELKSNDKDAYTEYVNHSVVQRDSKRYSQFVYNVKSVTTNQLKGYLELTTVEGKKFKSEDFNVSPGGVTTVTVLVEGQVSDVGFIKDRKLYVRPVIAFVDPLLPIK